MSELHGQDPHILSVFLHLCCGKAGRNGTESLIFLNHHQCLIFVMHLVAEQFQFKIIC